ncbi:HIT domain-containing protein [Rhodobaculum claviforme]|uniref:Histidine triad nucleotide-binding protein n=1 Tax=Rhodobaculum claviforme TaxID=1549854 RepID=A0A934TNF7_9RHOB|nr:HIT domain-containing protein [Rhodobaculum claviforme]MBK5928796.1 histidine triad nucleotide-binding protein [Rhodobaculum claviforme]
MTYTYDPQNVFARILRGEIPCTKVMETPHSLAFRDIAPQAPEHVLVIPKGAYVTFDHFAAQASDAEIVDFNRLIAQLCGLLGVAAPDKGYRLVSNAGRDGVQDVPHLHVHILAGKPLGRMLPGAKETP